MAKGRKKSTRKKESKKIEEINNFDGDILDKVYVALAVLLFLLAFYFLTVHITNKNKEEGKKEEKTETTVSSSKIIVGRSLSMSKKEYLVLFYDASDEETKNTYSEIYSNYKSKNEMSIYYVDMSSAFNKSYATDGESNKNPSKVSEFKINGPTLIKVSNKKVVNYIEGEDEIRTILN